MYILYLQCEQQALYSTVGLWKTCGQKRPAFPPLALMLNVMNPRPRLTYRRLQPPSRITTSPSPPSSSCLIASILDLLTLRPCPTLNSIYWELQVVLFSLGKSNLIIAITSCNVLQRISTQHRPQLLESKNLLSYPGPI